MKQNKVETTNENDFPPMKKNGYAICWDTIIEEGRVADVMFEIVNEDVFKFFFDSKHLQYYSDMFVDAVEAVKEDFLKGKGKNKKKLTKSDITAINSMGIHFVFQMFDDLKRGDERIQTLKDVCEKYFFDNKEFMVAGIAFALNRLKDNDELYEIQKPFTPKMSYDKAHQKNLKMMDTDEWNQIIVPADVKYSISKSKAHLDLFMWDEFIKCEYNTFKLAGHSDEEIIDILDSPQTIIGFCAYCEGYAEGYEEAQNENNN
jgi:hypothetical protein